MARRPQPRKLRQTRDPRWVFGAGVRWLKGRVNVRYLPAGVYAALASEPVFGALSAMETLGVAARVGNYYHPEAATFALLDAPVRRNQVVYGDIRSEEHTSEL